MTVESTKTLCTGLLTKLAAFATLESLKSVDATERTPLQHQRRAAVMPHASVLESAEHELTSTPSQQHLKVPLRQHCSEFYAVLRLSFQILLFGIVDFAPNFLSDVLTGHLSATNSSAFMAARSLAVIFTVFTSTTLVAAMSAAMDTLCAQAYGAGQLRDLGLFFQTGLIVFCIGYPSVVLASVYCVNLLEFAGQQRELAELAHNLVMLTLPGVPFIAVNTLMGKILQGQSRMTPLVVIGLVASLVQTALMYVFMFQTTLGFYGSAVAMSATTFCYAIALATYLQCSGLYQREWPGWQFAEAIQRIPEFVRLGVSGMAMFVCEVWSFATIGLSSGMLPHANTVVSADSSYINLRSLGLLWYTAIALAASVRVGNALGANDPARARHTAKLALSLSALCALGASVGMSLFHGVLPLVFTKDEQVINITSELLLVTSPLQVFTAIAAVTQGIFRGCGLQALGARVNFVSYVLLAVPLGLLLAFSLEMGLLGLWLGLHAGLIAGGLFSIYWLACRADWAKLAHQASKRATGTDNGVTTEAFSKFTTREKYLPSPDVTSDESSSCSDYVFGPSARLA
uniref:Multidrug/Oligosaccharidyl-lipid/Polysaccharide (MOP) Flippase Superfamily n=1 Tax=Hyaloperonospora arabidopsidis (strain Emoy2) TaxID=559515 RepID=M4C4J4_HYAAE